MGWGWGGRVLGGGAGEGLRRLTQIEDDDTRADIKERYIKADILDRLV